MVERLLVGALCTCLGAAGVVFVICVAAWASSQAYVAWVDALAYQPSCLIAR